MRNILFITALIFSAVLISSCSKYSKNSAGTYIGVVQNDGIVVDSNAVVVLEDLGQNRINVSSPYWSTYSVKMEKQRYFASVTYFSYDNNSSLEFTANNNLLIITTTGQNNESYSFVGNK